MYAPPGVLPQNLGLAHKPHGGVPQNPGPTHTPPEVARRILAPLNEPLGGVRRILDPLHGPQGALGRNLATERGRREAARRQPAPASLNSVHRVYYFHPDVNMPIDICLRVPDPNAYLPGRWKAGLQRTPSA